jgi:hypothetical protein
MSIIADVRIVDLLFVQDGLCRQVVAAPAFTASPGDLVEYIIPAEETVIGFTDAPEETRLGLVLKTMECKAFGNEWSCIAEIAQIRQAAAIYHPGWSRTQEDT